MKYDLACGDNKPGDDWIGVDIVETEDADVVADLRQGVPFESGVIEEGSADKIRIRHFIEHLTRDEVEDLLQDVYRLSKPGAEIEVITPYYLSDDAVAGDHKSLYSEKSFKCYDVSHSFPTPKPQLFSVEEIDLIWDSSIWVRLLRTVFPTTWVRNIPNAVLDIRYVLKVKSGDENMKTGEE